MGRPRKSPTYIISRQRNGKAVFYVDARKYHAVGGKVEALKAPDSRFATDNAELAMDLAAARLEELRQLALGRNVPGVSVRFSLESGVKAHLKKQADRQAVGLPWLEQAARHLARAIAYFGANCDPATIMPRHVESWDKALQLVPTRRHRGAGVEFLGPQTRRHHLNSLSRFFGFLAEEGAVSSGYNPVGDLKAKPKVKRTKARFLEVPAAGLFIHAAGELAPTRSHSIQFIQPLVAAFLYTGMRESELHQAYVEDFDFERELIEVRERDETGRLKTDEAARVIRFAPMLQQILAPYFAACGQGPEQLAFPSPDARNVQLYDTRKLLERVAKHAYDLAPTPKLQAAFCDATKLRTKVFRHTFCTARLQTLDNGKPIAVTTVVKEMGHTSLAMVEKVYGHLGTVRHRSDDVEYPCPPLPPR